MHVAHVLPTPPDAHHHPPSHTRQCDTTTLLINTTHTYSCPATPCCCAGPRIPTTDALACPSAFLGPSLPLALFHVHRRAPRPLPPPIRTNVLNILQDAAARTRILTDRTTYGVWAHNPNIGATPLVVAQAASAYPGSIFPLYDTSDAEARAVSAGEDLFLQEPSALSDLRTEHTKRVLQHGLLLTIIDFQNQCPFVFTEARCTATFSQDPDFPRLLTLARDGACKDLPPGLVSQPSFLPPRPVHSHVLPAIRWHAVNKRFCCPRQTCRTKSYSRSTTVT